MRSPSYELQEEGDRARSVVVITAPNILEGEMKVFESIAEKDLFRLHIRKPNLDQEALYKYSYKVAQIIEPSKITLHHNREVALSLNLGGIHGRDELLCLGGDFIKSRSCHSVKEVECSDDVDYMFLSPIFDSISKEGYRSQFDLDSLTLPQDRQVVALGGISIENVEKVAVAGFFSVALLGSVWGKATESLDIERATKNIRDIAALWRKVIDSK